MNPDDSLIAHRCWHPGSDEIFQSAPHLALKLTKKYNRERFALILKGFYIKPPQSCQYPILPLKQSKFFIAITTVGYGTGCASGWAVLSMPQISHMTPMYASWYRAISLQLINRGAI